MYMKRYTLYFACLVSTVFLLVGSWSAIGADQDAGNEPSGFEGLIEASELVNVGTPVQGLVDTVNVERSAFVKKGEPLVYLESSVENAVVERAQSLAKVEGEIQLQKEQLAFSRRMYKRVKELFDGDAISAEKRDQAATEVRLARARLQKAEENRKLAQFDLERARAMLARRTIKSPISGVVVERFVSPGELVDDQPLIKLAQMDPLKVEVILPAAMFTDIKPGMKAEITPETHTDGRYKATVTIVDRVIDPASGTFGVRLELPNPDYRLPGGLKCTVNFLGLSKDIAPSKTVDSLEPGEVAEITHW